MLHRPLFRALTGAAFALALSGASAPAAELRYAHVGSEGDIQTIYAAAVAEKIAASF